MYNSKIIKSIPKKYKICCICEIDLNMNNVGVISLNKKIVCKECMNKHNVKSFNNLLA